MWLIFNFIKIMIFNFNNYDFFNIKDNFNYLFQKFHFSTYNPVRTWDLNYPLFFKI